MNSQAYFDELLVRMAHHSTAIEGNPLTLEEVRALLLRGESPARASFPHVLEVENYKDLLSLLRAADGPVSLSTIRHIHEILMRRLDFNAGHFKTQENEIWGAPFQTTAPPLVSQALQNWADNLEYRIRRASDRKGKVFAIMEQHMRFERIHPFPDGNGRTGRALILYSCFREHLPPIIIEKEQRSEYIAALNRADAETLADMAIALMEKETVRAEAIDGKLMVSKPFQHKTIEERFKGFSGECVKENIDWNKPAGKEIW